MPEWSCLLMYEVTGYDRKTGRIATSHVVPEHRIASVKKVAGVPSSDDGLGSCPLDGNQVAEIARVLETSIGRLDLDYFLEAYDGSANQSENLRLPSGVISTEEQLCEVHGDGDCLNCACGWSGPAEEAWTHRDQRLDASDQILNRATVDRLLGFEFRVKMGAVAASYDEVAAAARAEERQLWREWLDRNQRDQELILEDDSDPAPDRLSRRRARSSSSSLY